VIAGSIGHSAALTKRRTAHSATARRGTHGGVGQDDEADVALKQDAMQGVYCIPRIRQILGGGHGFKQVSLKQ
jgi:hypothetical protein